MSWSRYENCSAQKLISASLPNTGAPSTVFSTLKYTNGSTLHVFTINTQDHNINFAILL